MAQQPVWTRAYLKSLGAKDDEIDYQNGAVTYKGKPFQYTTPGADGKAYGSQSELDSLYKKYQGNDALDQYKTNITKPPTPFTYDINSIKADPLYTSALGSFTQDTNRGTDTALVNLGRRGIGNSSSAVQAELSGQQSINDYANNKLAPSIIAQKYQQYLDANAQQDKQNQGLLGLANTYNTLNQQGFSNNLATNADNRAAQAQDFGQNVTKAELTGYFDDSTAVRKKIDENSAAYMLASPEEKKRLHDENVALAASIGGKDTTGNGDYSFGPGTRTLAGLNQDFNQGQVKYENTQNEKQREFENKLKTQMQGATIANMSADNARGWASEARAAGNQQLGQLFDVWDRTGVAPAGIPGVPAGTPINKGGGSSQSGNFNLDDYKGYINQNFYKETPDPNNFNKAVKSFDSAGARKYIIGLGLPDSQTDQILKLYGIPTN